MGIGGQCADDASLGREFVVKVVSLQFFFVGPWGGEGGGGDVVAQRAMMGVMSTAVYGD